MRKHSNVGLQREPTFLVEPANDGFVPSIAKLAPRPKARSR